MTPEQLTDRWFRRYEVGDHRGTIRYAYIRAEAAWRPGKRALIQDLIVPVSRVVASVASRVRP